MLSNHEYVNYLASHSHKYPGFVRSTSLSSLYFIKQYFFLISNRDILPQKYLLDLEDPAKFLTQNAIHTKYPRITSSAL